MLNAQTIERLMTAIIRNGGGSLEYHSARGLAVTLAAEDPAAQIAALVEIRQALDGQSIDTTFAGCQTLQ